MTCAFSIASNHPSTYIRYLQLLLSSTSPSSPRLQLPEHLDLLRLTPLALPPQPLLPGLQPGQDTANAALFLSSAASQGLPFPAPLLCES